MIIFKRRWVERARRLDAPPEMRRALHDDPHSLEEVLRRWGWKWLYAVDDSVALDYALRLAESAEERLLIAYHTSTSAKTLDRLANDPDEKVRMGVAIAGKLSLDTRRKLLADPSPSVRACAASGGTLTDEELVALADDESDAVRAAVARRVADQPTLARLAADAEERVQRGALYNPHLPRSVALEVIHKLSYRRDWWYDNELSLLRKHWGLT